LLRRKAKSMSKRRSKSETLREAGVVLALRVGTATAEQLAGPAPSLAEMGVNTDGLTPEEIAEIEQLVKEHWERGPVK
jgi:hypothetical protein